MRLCTLGMPIPSRGDLLEEDLAIEEHISIITETTEAFWKILIKTVLLDLIDFI